MTVEDAYLCGYLKIKGLTEVQCETRSRRGPGSLAYHGTGADALTFPLRVEEKWGGAALAVALSVSVIVLRNAQEVSRRLKVNFRLRQERNERRVAACRFDAHTVRGAAQFCTELVELHNAAFGHRRYEPL